MEKFLVKLIFRVDYEGQSSAEFDEQLRLLNADSARQALHMAGILGTQQSAVFSDTEGRPVSWNFIGVSEVLSMEKFSDGEQVCSYTHMTSDPKGFEKYVRCRSMYIEEKSIKFV